MMDSKTYHTDEVRSECAVPVGACDLDCASEEDTSKPYKKTKRGKGFGDTKCPLLAALSKARKRERSTANRALRVAEYLVSLPDITPSSESTPIDTKKTDVTSPNCAPAREPSHTYPPSAVYECRQCQLH